MAANANDAVLTMGYYNPAIFRTTTLWPMLYDCDNYFCSVIGPTDPNACTPWQFARSRRQDGRAVLQNVVTNRNGVLRPFDLHNHAGNNFRLADYVKVYSSPDETILGGILSDNVLPYFQNYQDPASVLHQKAFGPVFPYGFPPRNVASGNLSTRLLAGWFSADFGSPPAPSLFGEKCAVLILGALMANPSVWAKTVLFLTFDENGGFFDHVPPTTAPPGRRAST